ncbi:substrate-binding periplasmic protein [Pseudooceanicola onchidii]|uniref:substrate-binding periplasmic protein n=1 Tax=Pseudooceanicola onchidii TaxID=2562279 RepID=UPI0010AA3812|nr:transporter substrate-binding domain-containing protein [Pseudooceanicola onchidii]
MRLTAILPAVVVAGLSLVGPARAADPCADFVPQARPQNVGANEVGQDLDTLIDQGHMRFAVYADYPPYSWQEGSTPRGVDIDIARLIAQDLGIEARFTFVTADENLEADLRNNIWRGPVVGGRVSNVMMRIPYDSAFKCRVEQAVFTGQYAAESIAIAYARDAYPEEKPVPAYFRFDTVAVENDSISDFYLTGLAGGQAAANIHRFPAMSDGMAALDAGTVMAAMGPRGQLEYGLTRRTDLHQPPLAGFAVSRWTLGVAVNFRFRPLAYAVDDAVARALDDGRIAAIYATYGLTHQPPER